MTELIRIGYWSASPDDGLPSVDRFVDPDEVVAGLLARRADLEDAEVDDSFWRDDISRAGVGLTPDTASGGS